MSKSSLGQTDMDEFDERQIEEACNANNKERISNTMCAEIGFATKPNSYYT